MIVLSDHSQSQVEREIDLFKAFDGFGLEPPAPPRVRRDGEPPEIAVCPSSRSAQIYVLDRERRAELVPRIERTALASRVDSSASHRHPGGRPPPIRGRGATAVHARRHVDRPARRALERGGRPRPAQPERSRRPDRLRHLPGRARARLVGAALPHLGRGPALGPPRLRVHRLGRRSPRRRRLARVAARRRLLRLAAVVRHRPDSPRRSIVAARFVSDGARTSACPTVCGAPRAAILLALSPGAAALPPLPCALRRAAGGLGASTPDVLRPSGGRRAPRPPRPRAELRRVSPRQGKRRWCAVSSLPP